MPPVSLNKNNAAVKRIMQEARELANDPSTDYSAAPLEDDIFEWHCTLRGSSNTEFEGGLYHFRLLLPAEYPFRPPSIMMLTPNGRFELNTKICISFTSYHEEEWQPAWGVRTAILGLQGFFPLKGQAAMGVGSIEYPPSERKRLALLSREWVCPRCHQSNLECLPDPPASSSSVQSSSPSITSAESSSAILDVPSSSAPFPSLPYLTGSPSVDQSVGNAGPALNGMATITLSEHDPPISSEFVRPPPTVPILGNPLSSDGGAAIVRGHGGAARPVRSAQRPPLLLDTAICVLMALVFALVCRRIL